MTDEQAESNGVGGDEESAADARETAAVRGARFSGGPARGFMSSLAADERIFEADVAVDRAHVVMLAEQGVIDADEAGEILDALADIESAGHGALPDGEDVHEAIETAVIDRIGSVGGKMHTARSRNDEVATCIRYRLRTDLLDALRGLAEAREQLLDATAEHVETPMPGFTHLQYAQPITVGHYLASHEQALARDTERILAAFDRTNRSPLGAGAFGGTPFDIDRERTAELLGFDSVLGNSMDAVSTRDFLVETTAAMATLATTLSGLAEDMVVYAGRDYLEISDDYASTSSIMPQKKNPDSLEIVRARTGNATGSLQGLLTTLKGLPRSYNIDLQEATPHAWEAVDEVPAALEVAIGAVTTAEWNEAVLAAAAGAGFSTATGVADLLAMTGLPFRTAHEVVANAAQTFEESGEQPTYETIAAAAEDVLDDSLDSYVDREAVEEALDPVESVAMRNAAGGPAPEAVEAQLADAREDLSDDREAVDSRQDALDSAEKQLQTEVAQYV